MIIPLLGITYIITILGPSDASTTSHILFVHLRAVLLSTQVVIIVVAVIIVTNLVIDIVTDNIRGSQ